MRSCLLLFAVSLLVQGGATAPTRHLLLEGQAPHLPHANMMGVYELVEGKIVNDRPVWRAEGLGALSRLSDYPYRAQGPRHSATHLFYGDGVNGGAWVVSSEEDMEIGWVHGSLLVYSRALTPDSVTEVWHYFAGTTMNEGWASARKIAARVHTDADRRKTDAAVLKRAQKVGSIEVSSSSEQHRLLGVYDQLAGAVVCGRGVWRNRALPDTYLYYSTLLREWTICEGAENMRAGAPRGQVRARSPAWTPDKIPGTGTKWYRAGGDVVELNGEIYTVGHEGAPPGWDPLRDVTVKRLREEHSPTPAPKASSVSLQNEEVEVKEEEEEEEELLHLLPLLLKKQRNKPKKKLKKKEEL
jgi:hypothetical protein